MKTRVQQVLKAMETNAAEFWAQCKMLRLLGEDAVYCLENGDPMPSEPPPVGVDLDRPCNLNGKLGLVWSADPGPVGSQLVAACEFGSDVPNWHSWACGADVQGEELWLVTTEGKFVFNIGGLRNAKFVFDDKPYVFGFHKVTGLPIERFGQAA